LPKYGNHAVAAAITLGRHTFPVIFDQTISCSFRGKQKEVALQYQISGLAGGQLWIVYARNQATAEHIAALFLKVGYTEVAIIESEPI
jgi:hypothetical protein